MTLIGICWIICKSRAVSRSDFTCSVTTLQVTIAPI